MTASFRALLFAAIAAALPALALAQTTSTLEGIVTDPAGARVVGARVEIEGPTGMRAVVTDADGQYRAIAVAPGIYSISVTHSPFQHRRIDAVDVPINRTSVVDVRLELAAQAESVTVVGSVPAIDRTTSSTATFISQRQIDNLPLNGRNYLDLVLLTPGAVNSVSRAELTDRDTRGALFGERAGNTSFLIDGFDNSDDLRGGVFQAYTQDAIQEFQVIAAGYKAEFGRGSGGVVNAITRSGTNQTLGSGSFFFRDDAFDSSNVDGQPAPELARYDGSATVGGPVSRDRAWYFASAERVHERRESLFPATIPAVLKEHEDFSQYPVTNADRLFGKLSQALPAGRQLRIEGSWTRLENRDQLASASALPSANNDNTTKTGLAAIEYRAMSGARLYESSLSYRDQRFAQNQDLGSGFNQQVQFADGAGTFDIGPRYGSKQLLDQKYVTARANVSTFWRTHVAKAGIEYTHTAVDGDDSPGLLDLTITTQPNFALYGEESFAIPQGIAFLNPGDDLSRMRNHGAAAFVQDDWRVLPTLTLNLGARYDYDSEFNDTNNGALRLGAAWAPDARTAVRVNWGTFYDRYRLGLAQGVPEFGGYNGQTVVETDYPRLAADAIGNSRSLARVSTVTGDPFWVHHLFNIPANAVVTTNNVQALTGLTPDQFVTQIVAYASSRGVTLLPRPDFSPSTGYLRQNLSAAFQDVVRVRRPFDTPYNQTFTAGFERTLVRDVTVGSTYLHRAIRSVLGVRIPNLSLRSRGGATTTDDGGPLQRTYGPWYDGDYDALVFTADKPFNGRYQLQVSYTYASGDDNLLNPNLAFGVGTQGAGAVPTDNLNIELDRGPSDLVLTHAIVSSGLLQLPARVSVSGVLRATSGAPFSATTPGLNNDVDGDGVASSRSLGTTRNEFNGPASVNLDMRVEKRFAFGNRYTASALVEVFNLFNAANPRVVENQILATTGPVATFGETRIPLPGRELQFGLRLQF